MINTVIFDMDGLLIDSETSFYQIYNDIIAPTGQFFELEDYAQNYCGKTARLNMTQLINQFNLDMTIDEGVETLHRLEAEYSNKGIPLKKGAMELLDYLKKNNYKIVLGTSSVKERADVILKFNQITDYFDAMAFGTEVKNGKPHPDIFLKACEKVNVKPEEALVLEDSEAGIQAAFNANIPVICIPDMKHPSPYYVDMTECCLDSLDQVIDYLKR